MCRLRARSVRVLGVGAAAPRQQVLRQPQRPPGQRARGLVANGLALARTVGLARPGGLVPLRRVRKGHHKAEEPDGAYEALREADGHARGTPAGVDAQWRRSWRSSSQQDRTAARSTGFSEKAQRAPPAATGQWEGERARRNTGDGRCTHADRQRNCHMAAAGRAGQILPDLSARRD